MLDERRDDTVKFPDAYGDGLLRGEYYVIRLRHAAVQDPACHVSASAAIPWIDAGRADATAKLVEAGFACWD